MNTNINKRQTLINNEVKHTEAQRLNNYLDSLTYWERVEFVTAVVTQAGVKRQTFMNWKGMVCRIPEHAKQIIENEAGVRIFDDTAPSTEQLQP